jgi:hypothetical protein
MELPLLTKTDGQTIVSKADMLASRKDGFEGN